MNSFVCKFKNNDKSEQLSINIMQFLIFVVTARGLIENFIGHGTVLVDGVLILTLLYTFIKGIIVKEKFVFFYFTWLFMCFIIFLVQLLLDRTTVMGGILSFRNDVVYTFPFLFCISLIRTTDACKKIYNFMTNCGLAVCCFAIVQYFGRAFLPNKLLVVEGEGIFSFWGTDVIRVNGLVGNTIIFSNFAVIMTCYSWAHIINKEGNKKMYILFISSVIANLLTFSRASILGMVVAIIVEYFIVITDRCNRKEFIKRIFLILFVIIFIIVLFNQFWDLLSNTIIFQRFTNKNSLWNEGSDFIHSSSIIRSIEMIKQHPIIGFGLGKVGYSVSGQSLITDGTFWIYLLEWGVPICLFYWGFVCNMIINIARWIKSKVKYISSISLGFFVSNSYLIVAGLINSAYSARINLIYNWLFAGIIYVMIRNKSCDN